MKWFELDTASSHFLPSPDEQGLRIHLRSYTGPTNNRPLLFVHGATYGSRMYDIPVAGMSWLKNTWESGFPSYAIDIRGYGKSHSELMLQVNEPYATAKQAVEDISLAVNWLCERYGTDQVNIVGGSWGSITSSIYASTVGKGRVSALVLYAPIYSATNALWRELLADPCNPKSYNTGLGFHRSVDYLQTRIRWDEEIPVGETWRDEEVLDTLVQSSISDASPGSVAESFTVPNGTLVDLWQVFGEGNALYDPKEISCPVLLLRGTGDLTSTREDALHLFDLIDTPSKKYLEIAGGGHFISAERQAPEVFKAVNQFFMK